MEITYENIYIPGQDSQGKIHFNFTEENLAIDVWGPNNENGEDENLGSKTETIEDIIEKLCEENS